MGKPIAFAKAVDVAAVVRTVEWYAEAIDKMYDEIAPTGKEALGLITREPLGVVAAVVPWNFPLLMAAWKFGPMRNRWAAAGLSDGTLDPARPAA